MQEFNNLMRQFSSIHNDYYTGDKGITGRPHAMREIKDKRAINKQMRKIISQRAESVAITEHDFMDTNVVNKIMNPISSFDINSLATN